jgi:hypothetical protein
VVINEVEYDEPGTDGSEYIELKNNGPAAVDLGTYSIQLINGASGGAASCATFALPAVSWRQPVRRGSPRSST